MKRYVSEFAKELKAPRNSENNLTQQKKFNWETNVTKRKPEDWPQAHLSKAKEAEAAKRPLEKLPRTNSGNLNLSEIRENLSDELRSARRKVRR